MLLFELFEEDIKRKVFVVYGGGFQPFHRGHMSSYLQAKQAFPDADFYVAASNDTKVRPIPFVDKKFLAEQAGITDPFVEVKAPVNPREIMSNYDAKRDIFILIRSEKDPMSYVKKDGSPAYYQPFVSLDNCLPFEKKGYVFVTNKREFQVLGQDIDSGSMVREMYSGADTRSRIAIIKDLYPESNQHKRIKQLLDKYLS